MDSSAGLPRWQGPAAGTSLVAAGALAAASPATRRSAPQLATLRRQPSQGLAISGGWPKALRPLFWDEVPGRLEECQNRLTTLGDELGRLGGTTGKQFGSEQGGQASGDEDEREASDEELTESLSKLESGLVALHGTWRAVDEDRARAAGQRDRAAAGLRSSENRAEGLEAERRELGQRAAHLETEQAELRASLGVSEADVQEMLPREAEAEARTQALTTQSHELHSRLYTSLREVEDLRARAVWEEQARQLREERRREMEAEHKARRAALQGLVDRLQREFEEQLEREQREANQRERELRLAASEQALRQREAEAAIKRMTGDGMPSPPRWHKSAVPTPLTRRKRLAHGMVPGIPSMLERTETAAAPLVEHSPVVEVEDRTDAADALHVASEDVDILEALAQEGMYLAVPELVHARGAAFSRAHVGSNDAFEPASCRVDVATRRFCVQALEPCGIPHTIPLSGVASVSRDAAVVDLRFASLSEPSSAQAPMRKLHIAAPDEHGASALVAAVTIPDRVMPGSSLASGRTSLTSGVVHS